MNKTKVLMSLALAGATAVVGFASFAGLSSSGIIAGDTPHVHSGNHYAEILPTGKEIGVKEYWVCCSCHEHFLTQPEEGSWTDAVLPSSERAAIPQGDDRRVEPIFPYVRDEYKTYVSLNDNADGSWTVENKTSGVLSGTGQNWGESAPVFYQLYSALSSFGAKYLKFDVLFEESVQSFNLRFGSGVTEFYVTEVGFDTQFPWGRQLNFFDMNGNRVDRVSHNVWYTMYLEVVGDYVNAFWANGGSEEAPSKMQIRNIEAAYSINPSCAPYVKSGGGTVSIATEEGREGSFKVENGGNAVNFFGVTHTNAPAVDEFTGGFFDSDDYRYFVFDYWLDDTCVDWYLEGKGQGYASTLGRYCSAVKTAADATIYHNGEAVSYMQPGWNTCVVDMPHVGGGWTDFDLSLGNNIAYLRNIHYSKTPTIQ